MEPHLSDAASLGADSSVSRRQMLEKQAPFLLQARLIELWKQARSRTGDSPDSDFDAESAWVMRYSAAFRKLFIEDKDYLMAIFDEGRMREEEMKSLQARLDEVVGDAIAA